jgi:hypothetical protein
VLWLLIKGAKEQTVNAPSSGPPLQAIG